MVCCCCTLRTATIIVASFFLILSAAYSIILSIVITKTTNARQSQGDESFYSLMESSDFMKLIVGLMSSAVMFITSVTLIVGAARGNRRLLLPWIVSFSLGLVAWVGNSLFTMFQQNFKYRKNKFDGSRMVVYFAVFSVLLALNIYFLKIVIDHFKELEDSEREEENQDAENSTPGNPILHLWPNSPR